MSYESALIAAGCKVVEFQRFGSYRGDWYAMVELNGEKGIVTGCYGSCGGCDPFEGEFGYSCDEESDEYKTRLAEFGATYLPLLPASHFMEPIKKHIEKGWDWNYDGEILEWLERAVENGF